MGISFLKKKAIFTFRTAFSLSFAMKFQRRHRLEDFAWRVERVTTLPTELRGQKLFQQG
jgi:hypothetical protein